MAPMSGGDHTEESSNSMEEHESDSSEASSLSTDARKRPRICGIDVDAATVNAISDRGFNCFCGTLGPLIEVEHPNPSSKKFCLLQHDFPKNLHEYDVVVADLNNTKRQVYDEKEHISHVKGRHQRALLSRYPQTIFDPRPFSAKVLSDELDLFSRSDSILVVFAAEMETVEYETVTISSHGPEVDGTHTFGNYDFYPHTPKATNLSGRDTTLSIGGSSELGRLLTRQNDQCSFKITFDHPRDYTGTEYVDREDFVPLMRSASGGIVSFFTSWNECAVFVFPVFDRKEEFLVDLLERVLPELSPNLFPGNTNFHWLQNESYLLPNEATLQAERKSIEENYRRLTEDVNTRIQENRHRYAFLHGLLTLDGDDLVQAVQHFLTWLGFENVIDVDDLAEGPKEEDLRIELESGLVVIEVKGLGGTSRDSDCSQIGKIRYRRAKERGTFDVYAVYLVNHQRHLPPHQRTNPPFNATQIADAENDDRGLVSTFKLFNLYFDIERGFIRKQDARDSIVETGLVTFKPSNSRRLDPKEIHHNGQVIIIELDGFEIAPGMTALARTAHEEPLQPATILEVQVDGATVDQASSGEVGVRLSEAFGSSDALWLVDQEGSEST